MSATEKPRRRPRSRPAVERLEGICLLSGLPAFPGAVGFGADATGGRGGTAYHVTNLNDSGPGSFRDAVSRPDRIVVFDVGGNIDLQSAVSVKSNITIAGQTAPGDGIAVEGREVSFSNSHNDIVRYIRFRQGAADRDTGKSTVGMDSASDIIFDHVSIEFGSWDNIDVNGSTNITFENCIIADPIGQQFNVHQDSGNVTWYGDVFAEAHNRSPLAKGNTQFVNNVVYDFQAGYTAGNTSGHFSHDIINNYFITGPNTSNAGDAFYQMNNQSVYFQGNLEDSNRDGKLNGGAMGYPGGTTHLSAPWSPTTASLPTTSAADAYAYDVANAGDSPHRDEVDRQVIGDVTSLGKAGRLWAGGDQTRLFSNHGYPLLEDGPALPDSDGDGMPDGWELYYGLNPGDPSDGNGDFDGTGYTNIEKYINGLADGSYGWVPAPWQFGDVGDVGIPGSARPDASGGFTVNGSGSGIAGASDQFNFVSQGLTGDGSIVARVTSQANTSPGAQAGVMFRDSSSANAAFADVEATPGGRIFFRWRSSDGASAGYAVAYAQTPVWVELSRSGGSFSGYYSTDGVTWTQIGSSRTVSMSPTAQVGLAVSADNNVAVSTATFSDVSLTASVDLSGSFDEVGIVNDGMPFSGGLDGNGDAYSASQLGTSVTSGGYTFKLGAVGSNDAVQAMGQDLSLPAGDYRALSFLGTAVNGSQTGQSFTVNYTDGTSNTFTQDLSDWLSPQSFTGEAVAASLGSFGSADGSTPGASYYLYQYSFALNDQKTVSSITLPNNVNVVLLTLDLRS